jgi:hypothetical protein
MTFGVEKLKEKLVSAENCEETEFGVREIDVIQVKGERKSKFRHDKQTASKVHRHRR